MTHIVRAALRRAGVQAPINGVHVLRHSAATAMLRQGASLAGVGAVLRHRSPRTTAPLCQGGVRPAVGNRPALAGDSVMLTAHVERYLALRQALGFRLCDVARHLRAFARFAEASGDAHVRSSTAVNWAAQAPSPRARHVRLRRVAGLARFLHAEDLAHELPPPTVFHAPARRPLPHIYTLDQLAQIVAAASRLRETYTLRRRTYATLFGLIAATGLRLSEALGLRFGDVLPGGVLRVERTKFGKSRLVPCTPPRKRPSPQPTSPGSPEP